MFSVTVSLGAPTIEELWFPLRLMLDDPRPLNAEASMARTRSAVERANAASPVKLIDFVQTWSSAKLKVGKKTTRPAAARRLGCHQLLLDGTSRIALK
jgi:hypothetical protein